MSEPTNDEPAAAFDPATTRAYDGGPHRRIIAAAKQLKDAEEGACGAQSLRPAPATTRG